MFIKSFFGTKTMKEAYACKLRRDKQIERAGSKKKVDDQVNNRQSSKPIKDLEQSLWKEPAHDIEVDPSLSNSAKNLPQNDDDPDKMA